MSASQYSSKYAGFPDLIMRTATLTASALLKCKSVSCPGLQCTAPDTELSEKTTIIFSGFFGTDTWHSTEPVLIRAYPLDWLSAYDQNTCSIDRFGGCIPACTATLILAIS